MADIATAYVQIIPTTKDIKKSLTDELSGAGEEGAGKFSEAFSKALKVGAAAIGAAATAVGKIIGDSINNYADYEQLVGGVETLFGKSANIVQTYAANAYKTAGLSANEYMETVTGFSASLLASLGGDTQAAAIIADVAISDMSDNANKMGSDMESIQNAYAGFAKGQFTMLDNLKLGYGGTKTEMERLLLDAQALSGIEYDIDSYADIINAIHVIQEEMEITGTTAREASTTISGSLGMVKSAWANVLTAMADENADFDGVINNLVTSVTAFASNIIPRIQVALQGAATLITQLAPIIIEQLPALFEAILPGLLEAAVNLVSQVIIMLPGLIDMGLGLITQLIDSILMALPALLEMLPDIVEQISTSLVDQIPVLIQTGVDLFMSLVDKLPQIINDLMALMPTVVNGLITALLANIPSLIQAGVTLLISLINNLPTIIDTLMAAMPDIITGLISALMECIPQIIQAGVDLLLALIENLPFIIESIVLGVIGIVAAIVDAFKEKGGDMKSIGQNLLDGIWAGIQSTVSSFISNIKNVWANVVASAKEAFGIHSPSRVFNEVIGKNIMLGWQEGIEDNADLVTDAIDNVADMAVEDANATLGVSAALGTASGAEATNTLDTLVSLVSTLSNKLDQIGVYVDGKALVGEIVYDMDSALSRRGAAAARGY